MMISMLTFGRHSKGEAFGEHRLNVALFVAEVFANEKTGLSSTAPTDCSNTMLQYLYQENAMSDNGAQIISSSQILQDFEEGKTTLLAVDNHKYPCSIFDN
eukprot:15347906-Ditylum_brightwellii.AAC.2